MLREKNIKKSIVIIGGNDLAFEISELYKKNFHVYYLTRKIKKNLKIKNQIKINYNNDDIIGYLKKIKPIFVFNFLSVVSDDLEENFKINIDIPIKLLNWVNENNSSRLILTGTSSEYGYKRHKIVSEKSNLSPVNLYGLSKAIQSYLAHFYFKNFKSNFIIIRIFNLKGSIYNKNLLIGKVNNFIKKNFKKKKILKLGNLSSYRDYIDINYAAKLIFTLSFKSPKGRIINLGTGRPTLVRKLVDSIFVNYPKLRYIENKKKINVFEPKVLIANTKSLRDILKI